jgi:hypothetical protein
MDPGTIDEGSLYVQNRRKLEYEAEWTDRGRRAKRDKTKQRSV